MAGKMRQKYRQQNDIKLKIADKVLSMFFREQKAEEPIDLFTVKRILVIDYSLIGDTIMSIPFFRVLHNNCPNAIIDVVCSETEKTLLQDEKLINKYYIVNYKQLLSIEHPVSMLKYIKDVCNKVNNFGEYDIALEPRGDIRLLFFMHYCNAKRKVSYNYSGGEYFLTDVIPTEEKLCHLLDEKLNVLKFIGCTFDAADRIPSIARSKECVDFEKKFVQEHSLDNEVIIGIHPGSSLNIKKWEHFNELMIDLNNRVSNCCFIIFGGPGEDDADRMALCAREKSIKYIISKSKLKEYVYTLGVCDCVICNDSGAGHIAAALGVKTVALLGPFSSEYCAPVGRLSYPISKELECKPCLLRECQFGTKKCLNMISVQEVSNRVVQCIHDLT